jgi:hypothetical protein
VTATLLGHNTTERLPTPGLIHEEDDFSSLPPTALFVIFDCVIEEIGPIHSERGSHNERLINETENWN